MDEQQFYDLYLYVIPHSNKLVKISHLSRADAELYSTQWFDMNDMHDYMLVLEGDTPWVEPIPDISIKDPQWILSEYSKLVEEV